MAIAARRSRGGRGVLGRRWQRGAECALLLASGAVLGCSSSTDAASDAGVVNAARPGNAGTLASRGGARAPASTTVSGVGGSVGDPGQPGSACPGAVDPMHEPCRVLADCAPGTESCSIQTGSLSCHWPVLRECSPAPAATGCDAGFRCHTGECGSSVCVANCTDDSCPETSTCIGGLCVADRCDDEGAEPCPRGWSCDPTAANIDRNGCAPLPCGPTSPCGRNEECLPSSLFADVHGCAKRECETDTVCDCGYCVNGLCQPQLGFCYVGM